MGFISVKQYTPKLQQLSMFFAGKNQTKKKSCHRQDFSLHSTGFEPAAFRSGAERSIP